MADGTSYVLPPVHLAKGGVGTVDVNAALAQAPANVRPHLSQFGSASVKYTYDWQGVIQASMSILDTVRSLEYMPSFVFPARPSPADQTSPPTAQSSDGLWWRYARSSTGWVVLANTTDKPVGAEVSVSGLAVPVGQSVMLPAHGSAMLDLRNLVGGDAALVGGLHVAYSGTWGSVQVAGGLEDVARGFSTDVPLAWHLPPADTAGPRQLAAAGVMINSQDPLLNFPASVNFRPYAYFRNISAVAKTLRFTVYYMPSRTAASLQLPDLTLQPGEAQSLPIAALTQKLTQVQDFTLAYSYEGYWGDILAGIGSTDQSGNYVFPVVPSAAFKGGARASHYWLADGGFDTMYTLWNPEPDAEDVLVTLKYGDGQIYKLPLTLEAHATAMVDIGELIRTQQLDQDGKILPANVKQGSLVVSAPANEPEDAIDVVVGVGIYNPTKATCGGGCMTCNGFVSPFFTPGTWSFAVGNTQQLQFGYYDNLGYQYTVSGGSNWSSSASQVIGVQSTGQGSPGLSAAISSGSSNINAAYLYQVNVGVGQMCTQGSPPFCPQIYINGSGSGTVSTRVISGVKYVNTTGQRSLTSADCGAGQAGYRRDVTLTLVDQGGAPVKTAGISVADAISQGNPNDLRLNATRTGATSTNNYGQWPDTYTVCSPACPGSAGKTIATQSWTADGKSLPLGNGIVYKCGSITIDGN